jgi:hypothetical protein
MRTCRRAPTRHLSVAAAALLAVIGSPQRLLAQPPGEPLRFTAHVAIGLMRPAEAVVREIYGSPLVPVTVGLDVRVAGRLLVFGSVGVLRKTGEASITGSAVIDEHNPLRLTTWTASGGAGVALPWQRWLFSARAGATFAAYRETWTETELSSSGHAIGFLAQGGGEFSLSRRVGVVGRLEYSTSPTGKGTAQEPKVDLGGFSTSAGLAIRF